MAKKYSTAKLVDKIFENVEKINDQEKQIQAVMAKNFLNSFKNSAFKISPPVKKSPTQLEFTLKKQDTEIRALIQLDPQNRYPEKKAYISLEPSNLKNQGQSLAEVDYFDPSTYIQDELLEGLKHLEHEINENAAQTLAEQIHLIIKKIGEKYWIIWSESIN